MKLTLKCLTLAIFLLSVSGDKRYCNDGLGLCTAFNGCSNSTVFNDGSDHINVRFNIELETDACHYLEMCCDPEDVVDVTFPAFSETATENPRFTADTTEKEDTHPYVFDNVVPVRPLSSSQTSDPTATDLPQGRNVSPDDSDETESYSSVTDAVTFPPSNDSCDDQTHECIPYYYCMKDHTNDGSSVLTSRVGANDKCSTVSQVCCEKKHNLARFKPSACGVRNPSGLGYSVTNSVDEAQYAEFPWMAAISEILPSGEGKYICGGSLIDPHVVLTAAHCVNGKDLSKLVVRLGEWDTQTINEILPHSDHEVVQTIVHPDFGAVNMFNDIALLVLKNPAELRGHINTVCLPPQNYKFGNENCFASGWGTDKFGDNDLYRVNLKKLELPIVPLKDCQENLRSTKLGARFRLNTNFMCAGGERDIDTCTGDGGGPLVYPVEGRENAFYQAGIVSWGIECGHENVPGVYTNVAKFRNWIDEQMTELDFGTSSYTTE